MSGSRLLFCGFVAVLCGSAVFCQSTSSQAPGGFQPQSVPTSPVPANQDNGTRGTLTLDSVSIGDPKKAKANSAATLIVNGTGFKNGDTSLSIFGQSYSLTDINADGSSGSVKLTLPGDYNPNKQYDAVVRSTAAAASAPAVTLDTLTGGTALPDAKDLDAQRKVWERQSKQMEGYIKAGQRYAIDVARLRAVQQQIRQAVQPRPPRTQPKSVLPSGSSEGPNKYCQPDSTQEASSIRLRRAVMAPKEASDAFGRRIGRRFIVFQVTIENNNKNYQYMVHDVSIDLSRLFNQPPGSYEWAFSTRELSLLRGVPEKGQDLDPRNLTFHVLRGIGTVAGGVTGLTPFQDIFGPSVAAYNGPFLSSFIDIAPDHTATQLNRLSDSAFATNSVVGKQQAKAFAVFVPQSLFMSTAEQNEYWKEPINILSSPTLDFRNADLCVDGAFVTELSMFALRSIGFVDAGKAIASATLTLKLSGTGLASGDTLSLFGNTYQLKNVSSDGTSAEADVALPGNYNPKQMYPATLTSGRTGEKTAPINLPSANGLTLASVTLADAKNIAPNAKVTLKLTGTNLISGDTVLNIWGTTTQVQNVTADGTTAEAMLTVPGNYDPKQSYPATLSSSKTGEKSASVNLSGTTGLVSSSIVFADPKSAKPNAKVTLKLTGKNFVAGDTVLDIFGASAQLKNVSADAASAEADVTLPAAYDPKQSYPATLTSTKSGEKTPPVNLAAAGGVEPLALTAISFAEPKSAKPNAKVTLKLTGKNFVAGDTVLDIFGAPAQLKNVSADAASAEADVTLPAAYDPKQSYPATLTSTKSNEKTAPVNLAPLTTPVTGGGALDLTAISFADPSSAKPNAKVTLKLTGKNFVAGDTVLTICRIPAQVKEISGGGTLGVVELTLPPTYDPKQSCAGILSSTKTGEKTQPVQLPGATTGK